MVSTEHLIEIVKKYPQLYDSLHPKFGNKATQEELWMRISRMFKADVKTVKAAWENIRETFIKYMKEEKCDGDRHMKKGYSYLHFVKCMDYFKPFLNITNGAKPKRSLSPRSKSTERDLSDHSESTDISVSFSDDFLSELKNPIKERRNANKNEFLHRNIGSGVPLMVNKNNLAHPATQNQEVQSSLLDDDDQSDVQGSQLSPLKRHQDVFYLDYPMKSFYMNRDYNTTLDAIELIFLGYAKTLKTFSPIRQTYTKMKIAQIIMEQEMQHLDENPNSPSKLISSTHANLILGNWKDANKRDPKAK